MSLIPRPLLDQFRAAFREWHNLWGHVYPHESVLRGAGAPTLSAAQGILYLDTTGLALYVNNDGDTNWTKVGPA